MKRMHKYLITALLMGLAFVTLGLAGAGGDPIDETPIDRTVVMEPEPVPEPVVPEPEPEPEPEGWSDEVVAYARVCVSEITFETENDDGEKVVDCGAIIQVVRYHARESERYAGSEMAALRRMSRKPFNLERDDARRWIAHLDATEAQPAGWPSTMTWDPSRWQARLAEVDGYVSGATPLPCPGDVFHWGGPHVDRDRIASGRAKNFWRPVDCGPTLNTFLAPMSSVRASVARGNHQRE